MTGPAHQTVVAGLRTATPGDPEGGRPWLSSEARALRARFPARTAAGTWDATFLDRGALGARSLAPPFALENPASSRHRRLAPPHVLDRPQDRPRPPWPDPWNGDGAAPANRT